MWTFLWKRVLCDPPEETYLLSSLQKQPRNRHLSPGSSNALGCALPWAWHSQLVGTGHFSQSFMTMGGKHPFFLFFFFFYELFHTISLKTNIWHILHRHHGFSMFGGHHSPTQIPETRGDRVWLQRLQTQLWWPQGSTAGRLNLSLVTLGVSCTPPGPLCGACHSQMSPPSEHSPSLLAA